MLVINQNDLVGQCLRVRPIYGWGWHRIDDPSVSVDYKAIQTAGDFAVLVESFFTFRGEVRGIIGRVHESEFFPDCNIIAGTMHEGDHNFRDDLCLRWDLEIGTGRVLSEEWPQLAHDSAVWGGHAIVAETVLLIDTFWLANGRFREAAT